MSYVFISYAATDRNIALRVRERLTEAGIETWMDVDLKPGADGVEIIRESVRNASSGLVLLSPAVANSPEVASEYKTILSQNKRLNVAMVAPIISPHDIPYHLQSIRAIDLQWDFEAGMRKLIAAIRGETPETESRKENLSASVLLQESQLETSDDDTTSDSRTSKKRTSVKLEVNLNNLDEAKTKTLIDLVTKLTEAGIEEISVVDLND